MSGKVPAIAALRIQVQAVVGQLQLVDQQLEAMQDAPEDEADLQHQPCPGCGGREFADAGDDVWVCADCNRNLRKAEDGGWEEIHG